MESGNRESLGEQRAKRVKAKGDRTRSKKETKRKEFEDKKKNKIQEGITLAEAINRASTEQYPGEHKLLVTLRIMSCKSAAVILPQDILTRKGEIKLLCDRENSVHPNYVGPQDETTNALLTQAYQALQNAKLMIKKAIQGRP